MRNWIFYLLLSLSLIGSSCLSSCDKDEPKNDTENTIPGDDNGGEDNPGDDNGGEDNPGDDSNDENDTSWIDNTFAKLLEERGYIASAQKLTKEEASKIQYIDVSGEDYSNRGPLTSLRGIEYFTGLIYLDCSSNHIPTIDVSTLSKLETLKCVENEMIALDISNNPKLFELLCYTNNIRNLDLSHNPEITILDCSNNRFNTLDVSNQSMLTHLTCSYLNLTSLDVSNNPRLQDLRCHGNRLKELDISNLWDLGVLDIRWNSGENGIFTLYVWWNENQECPFWLADPSWDDNGREVKVEFIYSNPN